MIINKDTKLNHVKNKEKYWKAENEEILDQMNSLRKTMHDRIASISILKITVFELRFSGRKGRQEKMSEEKGRGEDGVGWGRQGNKGVRFIKDSY